MKALGYIGNLIKTRSGKSVTPRMLTYIVTFRCNARCIMCDSWKKESDKDEMSLEEIDNLFKQLSPMDVVRLSGGEPFVREDLGEIAELARMKLKPSLLHITSNGFLTDRIVSFCEKRNKSLPLFMLFSIDGMKEKHNYIRGTNQAWDRVNRTISLLAPRRKELNLTIAVNQTIVDRDGVDHYLKLNDHLHQYGIQNNVVMAYDASATYSADPNALDIAPKEMGEFFTYGDFSNDEIARLFTEAGKNLQHYPFSERISKKYYFKGITNRLLHDKADPNPPCVALNSHMRLYPDGSIPVCQFNSATVGNVKNDPFKDVWFGEKAEKMRKWVKNCPGCWAECEILPNAFYTGNILSQLFKG